MNSSNLSLEMQDDTLTVYEKDAPSGPSTGPPQDDTLTVYEKDTSSGPSTGPPQDQSTVDVYEDVTTVREIPKHVPRAGPSKPMGPPTPSKKMAKPKETYTFLVLGPEGTGKSYVCNKLLGERKFRDTYSAKTLQVAHSYRDITDSAQETKTTTPYTIRVMLTPDITDWNGQRQKEEVGLWKKAIERADHLIVLFTVCSVPGAEKDFEKTYQTLKGYLGKMLNGIFLARTFTEMNWGDPVLPTELSNIKQNRRCVEFTQGSDGAGEVGDCIAFYEHERKKGACCYCC